MGLSEEEMRELFDGITGTDADKELARKVYYKVFKGEEKDGTETTTTLHEQQAEL
jgi:hypothetical protein